MKVVFHLRVRGFRGALCAPTWWQRKVIDFMIWRGRNNVHQWRYNQSLYWVWLRCKEQV